MIKNILLAALPGLVVISPAIYSQDTTVDIKPRFDPFKKPQRVVKAPIKKQSSVNLFHSRLKLFATLRAGKNSMVNVQGKLVQLGEEIEGYKLVEVNDRSAVFANSEQRLLLSLDTK